MSPPITFRARHADGSWLHVELGTNNLLDDEEVRGVVILGRDVTERVHSEEETRRRNEELERRVVGRTWQLEALVEELRENEQTLREGVERFRKLNEATFEGIVIREKGRILECNEAFAGMFGYEPEETVGMSALDFVVPESRDLMLQKAESGSEDPYEAVGIKKDGTRIVIETRRSSSTYRGHPVRLNAVRDVTELRERERALRESEERFRTTFEEAAVGIAHVDLDGRWLRVNPKLCETVGYTCEDLLSKTFQEVTHPEDLDADLEQVRRLLAGEIHGYSMHKRYVKRDGSHVWINLRVSLVRESCGAPSYFISVVENIDERKKAELALRSLTRREEEVLMLLGEGLTNPEIAEKLAVSVGTVKFHVQNVVEKLGVVDRRRAAERAQQLGLLPDAP